MKRISQETFDEVVKENLEDFGMEQSEAIKDAIDQFNKQDVDLSNIDTTGGVGRDEMKSNIKDLISYRDGNSEINIERVIEELMSQCDDKNELGKRNQSMLLFDGGFNALHDLMKSSLPNNILGLVLEFMGNLCRANLELRDFFEPGGSAKICKILEEKLEDSSSNVDVIKIILNLAKIVEKSENNKVMLVKSGFGILLSKIIGDDRINQEIVDSDWASIFQLSCAAMRGLCIHDDIRREMSCAYDNGRYFLSATGVVSSLMKAGSRFVEFPLVASTALLAAKALITTEESVKIMTQNGAMNLPRDILGHPGAQVDLVRSLLGLMRNLCADDVRKEKLVTDGTLERMVAIMTSETYQADAPLVEHALACLAAMTLRSPSNSSRIVSIGAVDVMCRCMLKHENRTGLQRQGCLAIRNIAARCVDLRGTLLDAGVENVLRKAGRFQDCVDEAYGALRDLGCDVQRVKISEDGSVGSAYEQFGQKSNTSFRPVFEESDVLERQIQAESRAPFARDHHDHDFDDHAHTHDHHDGDCCGGH